MVGTEYSCPELEHFAWQLQNCHPMNASLGMKHQENLPTLTKNENCKFPTHMGMQGFAVPPLPSFRVEQKNVVHGSRQCLYPHFQNPLDTPRPYQKEKESLHSAGLGGMFVPKSNFGTFPKGFLIFDQSGSQKRLMYSSVCPPVYISSTVAENHHAYGWLEEEWAAGDVNSVEDFSHTLHYENHIAGEESEMHENTEEIDALLYSDDNSNSFSSDDEVTSTGHSPEMINERCEKEEQCQEITTEVACFDEQCQDITTAVASSDGPRKRQRVGDGGYIESLPIAAVTCPQVDELQKFASDAESSCSIGLEEANGMYFGFNEFSLKKDRIRETLRVIETLVPGAKGKDPLLVIDEAIDYLKSLKQEAKALGVSCYENANPF